MKSNPRFVTRQDIDKHRSVEGGLFRSGDSIWRIKTVFGDIVNAVEVKPNTLRAKMNASVKRFDLNKIL